MKMKIDFSKQDAINKGAISEKVKYIKCKYCGRDIPDYAICNCNEKVLYEKIISDMNMNILDNTFFEKVSLKQYKEDFKNYINRGISDEDIENIYNNIKLPTRSTDGSAGYDFYLPRTIGVVPNQTTKVLTGIRASINNGWCLLCIPKSGLGSKYGLRLENTIGLIDSDYYNSSNEGHIMAALNTNNYIELEANQKFMQGVFVQYGITKDDSNTEKQTRTGGFGSTGK